MIKIAIFCCLLAGCCTTGFAPGADPNFWTQKITFTGWGFTMATGYGPFNIGYLSWQRNVDQPQKPASPADVVDPLGQLTK